MVFLPLPGKLFLQFLARQFGKGKAPLRRPPLFSPQRSLFPSRRDRRAF